MSNQPVPNATRTGSLDIVGWARTHRLQAAAVPVAGVVAFALYKRHQAAGASSLTGTTANNTGTDQSGAAIAGLTAPDTTTTDIENWVQDALNSENDQVNAALAASQAAGQSGTTTTPAAPAPPPAAPSPSSGFLLQKGLHYVRNTVNGWIGQVNPTTGALTGLTASQWAEVRSLGPGSYTLTEYSQGPAPTASRNTPMPTTPPKKA